MTPERRAEVVKRLREIDLGPLGGPLTDVFRDAADALEATGETPGFAGGGSIGFGAAASAEAPAAETIPDGICLFCGESYRR